MTKKTKRRSPSDDGEACPKCGSILVEYEHHKGFEGGYPSMTLECLACEYKLILCDGVTAEDYLAKYTEDVTSRNWR